MSELWSRTEVNPMVMILLQIQLIKILRRKTPSCSKSLLVCI